MKKIVLAGPPRSGKSCMREGLKQALKTIPGAPYPYVITACPDGEGSWFQETVNNDPEVAGRCKAAYKAKFTPEFVKRITDSVKNCQLPLTLVDIGGITSAENEEICRHATTAIILAGDKAKIPEWREFFAKLQIPVLAEIWSDYRGAIDIAPTRCEDGIYRGWVHHLERGEPVSERLAIKALAKIIVNL